MVEAEFYVYRMIFDEIESETATQLVVSAEVGADPVDIGKDIYGPSAGHHIGVANRGFWKDPRKEKGESNDSNVMVVG